ncbi:hypothetical protein A2303_07670 [Candidatus Falkowbacteria bacterium RIFOXYB2_FULL_47_14]|uniref:Septum formation initiator n=1 Tax=Candidatus Falkowbacteria bacterium RIFOXYA2_FULL_47_19 TaxID=1797994 RepID=A0A1F5SMH5_9BACT|nr:MAG: hypothetical protein A2227_04815 [Candidatus Falkowbacteria bacterium RIFOXYA2_FULL_47_19]OGF36010.1 MAG: hypothetical protein A2468_00520 [Candidatus Falkowbacteria bacterium RIFOXYC2_FULL_46_15]OGF43400.1 MAG: hypothetical protein A2303_07670 [Candidatus Falkowbacteria bacterium RIFOXYB2_FULL_47_14]
MIKDKKNFLRSVFSSQITLTVVGFLIVIGISIPLAKNVSKQYRIGKEIKELEKEISYLENSNSELQRLVKYLESDQFALEQARSNLNYKQPGEEVVVIKNDDSRDGEKPADTAAGGTKSGVIEAKSNPGKWWYYFFN